MPVPPMPQPYYLAQLATFYGGQESSINIMLLLASIVVLTLWLHPPTGRVMAATLLVTLIAGNLALFMLGG